jgi:hypothetical protein
MRLFQVVIDNGKAAFAHRANNIEKSSSPISHKDPQGFLKSGRSAPSSNSPQKHINGRTLASGENIAKQALKSLEVPGSIRKRTLSLDDRVLQPKGTINYNSH